MRRLALFAPLLILALAQVEPLRRALQAHGFQGREVRALYQEDRLTLYTPQGQVAEVGLSRAWLDPKGCRYRQEVLPGGREEGRSVVLFTPALQALLLPDGRRVPLPDPLLLDLLRGFDTGLPGLLHPPERVEAVGEVALPGGRKGLGYRVGRGRPTCRPRGVLEAAGWEGMVVLDGEGRLLAERYPSAVFGGEVLVAYGDYREVGGVLFPFRAEGYLGEARLFLGETLRLEVNPSLPEGLFTLPPP
ncbi:MAG: hypothetical protein ACK4G4_11185 [Thermus sp.]|uniref:hypothetical protein n=1 Tax=Thermus TaxID=270 RepID=UPI001FCDB885|nr:hypothetical protein [Thermus thermophilus]BDG22654.1 hypothetical protein TthSNM17_23160 [Thermus thermophilus]